MSRWSGVGGLVLVCLLGAVLGAVGARYVFVNSGLSLVPWGLVALAIGYLGTSLRRTIVAAAVFGFALATTFMFVGYEGRDPVIEKTLPFVLIGLVGAVCANIPALAGHVLGGRRRTRTDR